MGLFYIYLLLESSEDGVKGSRLLPVLVTCNDIVCTVTKLLFLQVAVVSLWLSYSIYT